jgi:hypothetical protein
MRQLTVVERQEVNGAGMMLLGGTLVAGAATFVTMMNVSSVNQSSTMCGLYDMPDVSEMFNFSEMLQTGSASKAAYLSVPLVILGLAALY